MKRLVFATVAILGVMSCSSDDDSDNTNAGIAMPDIVIPSGDYTLVVTAITEISTDGGTCGDANGSFEINDGTIMGTAVSTNGFVFDITGQINTAGEVTGGFAVSGTTAASYTGSITDNIISGSWDEDTGCSGIWQADIAL